MKITEKRKDLQSVQDLGLEKAVLGCLISVSDTVFLVDDILCDQCFTTQEHKDIYRAIIKLRDENRPRDLMLVYAELKTLKSNISVSYLTELTLNQASPAHVKEYALILKQIKVRIAIMRISETMNQKAYDLLEDPLLLLEEYEREILGVSGDLTYDSSVTLKEASSSFLDFLEQEKERKKKGEKESKILTGIEEFDLVFGGFKAGQMITLAAATGMGKSSFALNIALNILRDGKNVAFFSLEMNEHEIANKSLACLSGVDSYKIENSFWKEHEHEEVLKAYYELKKLESNLFLECKHLNLSDFKRKSRILRKKNKVDIIILDYLQLIENNSNSRNNREQDVSTISRTCKQLAMELGIPIITLAQLSRAVHTTNDRKPKLHHLRDSGSIEQDSNAVLFLYSDDYYNEDPSQHTGIVELIVAKNRGGKTGCVQVKFDKKTSKFSCIQVDFDKKTS